MFPGFSGFAVGVAILVGICVVASSQTGHGSFTFDKPGQPGSFEARLTNYIRAGEFVVGLATSSIVILVGSSALYAGGHLPWVYASPLILLALSVVYGILFMVLIVFNYEAFQHNPGCYTRARYVRNQALGFSSLVCFCGGYLWLVLAITR
ncbi:MAG TPA: hypothetical protein VII95_00760 [Terriglobales bacterium]